MIVTNWRGRQCTGEHRYLVIDILNNRSHENFFYVGRISKVLVFKEMFQLMTRHMIKDHTDNERKPAPATSY